MYSQQILRTIITGFCMLFSIIGSVFAQEPGSSPAPDNVTIVGGGGFPVENERIYNSSGMDDFSTVYSASDDLRITLKDVYITDNLAVFTLSLRTTSSASNHISSGSVYINGVQRTGGGSAGEFTGEPYEQTMTFVFYGGLPEAAAGAEWDSLRISFDDLIFTFSDGREMNDLTAFDDYDWSFVFHNPEVSGYAGQQADEQGVHTFGSSVDLWLGRSSVIYDKLYLHLITKSERINNEAMEERLWVDSTRGIVDEGLMNLDVSDDAHFTRRDQFELSLPEGFLAMYDLSVWAPSMHFELDYYDGTGNLRSWSAELNDETSFPKQIVRFVHPEARLPMPEDEALYSTKVNGITMDIVSLDSISIPLARWWGIWTETGVLDYLQVGICFSTPDDGEWILLPGTAKIGEQELMAQSFTNGGSIAASAEKQGRVCASLGYNVSGFVSDINASMHIEIERLIAQPREGSPCQDIMRRFETNAAAQALGVTLKCEDNVTDEWVRGPKDYILTVESFDSTKWTREEALHEVESLLDSQISGPWIFEFE